MELGNIICDDIDISVESLIRNRMFNQFTLLVDCKVEDEIYDFIEDVVHVVIVNGIMDLV